MRLKGLVAIYLCVVILISGLLMVPLTAQSVKGMPVQLNYKVWDDGGYEYGYSIAPTNDSGVVAVGRGHNDLLIVKFDSNTNVQWKKYIDAGSTAENLLSVITDDDGYIIAVGYKENISIGKDDFVMIKMDVCGNIIWENITNDNYPNGANDILFDPSDNTYVVVGRWGTTEAHAHLWKFDKNGGLIWDKNVSRSDYGWNTLTGITMYNSTTYSVCGYGDGPSGTKDVFIELVDKNGNVVKSFSFGSSTYNDYGNRITVDLSGYIYASTHVNKQTHLYKFDKNGNKIWDFYLNDSYDNWYSITQYNNNILLMGSQAYQNGNANVSIIKLDYNGDIIWEYNESVTGKDYIKNFAWISNDEFYLVGNTTTANDNLLIIHYALDNIPPSISIVYPQNNTYLNVTNISLSWSGNDHYGIDHYEVKADSGDWLNVDLNTSYQFTNLAEGEHTLYVKAVDYAGNENTTSVHIIVDLSRPYLNIVEPPYKFTNSTTVTLGWESYDNYGIDHYEVKVDNNNLLNVGLSTSYQFTNLAVGNHKLYVKAVDLSGNVREDYVNIVVDLTSPSIIIENPQEGGYINTTTIDVMWSVNDINLREVFINIDNGNWHNVTGINDYKLNLSEGKHVIYINATDFAGNYNITSVQFYVDTHPPIISDFNATQKGDKIEISWNAMDNVSGVYYYMIKIDDGKWKNVTDSKILVKGLSPGSHRIVIRAYDRAGNFKEAGYNFKVTEGFPWLWLIIGIVLAIVAAILLVIFFMRKSVNTQKSDEEG